MIWCLFKAIGVVGTAVLPVLAWVSDKLLAPALVAVVFTGLTNFTIDRMKANRDVASKVSDELRTDLRELQRLALDYWSRARKSDDIVVEAKILAMQSDVIAAADVLRTAFKIELFETEDASVDFLDALTGGQFEAQDRTADPARVRRVSELIGAMRSRTSSLRLARLKRTGQ